MPDFRHPPLGKGGMREGQDPPLQNTLVKHRRGGSCIRPNTPPKEASFRACREILVLPIRYTRQSGPRSLDFARDDASFGCVLRANAVRPYENTITFIPYGRGELCSPAMAPLVGERHFKLVEKSWCYRYGIHDNQDQDPSTALGMTHPLDAFCGRGSAPPLRNTLVKDCRGEHRSSAGF